MHHLRDAPGFVAVVAVLTIGKLGASADQLEYYEQQVAQGLEDYFSGRGEAPGRWIGGGCGGVGIAGRRVEREGFMRAMAGCDPGSGERLRPVHAQSKVAAFDLTFSAPKSLSVLFAIADQQTSQALLDAHERAVEAAFCYIEREACFTRRGRNGSRRVRGEGFIAAAYRHRLSRSGDPQLHTHVVLANMTRAEGRYTTLEAHGIYEHKSAGGALYRAVLRAEVRERLPWVCWRAAGRGLFEIEGVPQAVLREFSRRRVEIEQRALQLTGVAAAKLSRERLQGIALQTRKAKEYRVDGARWRAEAQARAAEHGLGADELQRLYRRAPTPAARRSESEVLRGAVSRLSGSEGLTAQHNTFAARHALAEIAGEFDQGASIAALERTTRAYLQHGTVVSLGQVQGEHRFTTKGLLACERAIVEHAASHTGPPKALDRRLVDQVLGGLAEPLSEQQAAAAHALAAAGGALVTLQALAGTGKTRTLAALARVYEAAGCHVVGVAPTGRAARELASSAGIPAYTIQRLCLQAEQDGGLGARTVLLFDEAGTAPTRPSAQLLELAAAAGAKVIAAGDGGQLPAVAAGGWFAAIAPAGSEVPQLREVIRQREQAEREALSRLHDGDSDPYIDFKRSQGALTVHDQETQALAGTLADWDRARRQHGLREAIMIARDNATRALLNDCARRLLIEEGAIGETMRLGEQTFSVGQRVIARRNDRWRDLDNGTLGQILAIDKRQQKLQILTDSGAERTIDAAYATEYLQPAYALTGHSAHGGTFESVTVIGRPSEFTREWSYTALSRARGQTHLHLIAEASPAQREREDYAPPEPPRSSEEALELLRGAMRRREGEQLALQHTDAEQRHTATGRVLNPSPSAVPDATPTPSAPVNPRPDEHCPLPTEPSWRQLRERRSSREGDRGLER